MRFIGRLLAILIVLQAVAVGAASQTTGRAGAQTGEAILFAGGDCSLDAAEGKSPQRRAHADCCVLCSIGCSDKLAFQVAVLLARAEFQAPRRSIAAARAGGLFVMRSASTGAASSRGPPRFS